MNCKKCNAPIAEGSLFCSECGERVVYQERVNNQTEYNSAENANSYNTNNVNYQNNTNYQNNSAYGKGADYQNNNNYQNNAGYGNNENYSQYYSAGGAYNNNGYQQYQGAPYGNPVENDKAPTIKDYLKWMLLYPLLNFIPGVGFIIYFALCIKHAFDTSNKGRSNYFKAILITMAATLAVTIVMMILIFGVLGFAVDTGMEIFKEVYPEIFDESYGGLPSPEIFDEFGAAGGYYTNIYIKKSPDCEIGALII